jgi:hypothetical protein
MRAFQACALRCDPASLAPLFGVPAANIGTYPREVPRRFGCVGVVAVWLGIGVPFPIAFGESANLVHQCCIRVRGPKLPVLTAIVEVPAQLLAPPGILALMTPRRVFEAGRIPSMIPPALKARVDSPVRVT